MTVRTRRLLALALALAAPLVVAATVLAVVEDRGYIYLRPLAFPLAGAGLALFLLAGVVQLTLPHPSVRSGLQLVAVFLAVLALCAEAYLQMIFSPFSTSQASVATTSANFRVAVYEVPGLFLSPGSFELRLQSREGLVSREGREALACFIEPGYRSGPEWLFDRAQLTGKDEVQVFAKDGTMWRIRFDRRTLLPVNYPDRCSEAPFVGW